MQRVAVDATVEPGGLTAIAGVLEGRDVRPLFMDVLNLGGHHVNEAELHAMYEAMRIAQEARWGRVNFFTDSQAVNRFVNRRALGVTGTREQHVLVMRIRAFLREHEDWIVSQIQRKGNVAAHTLCSQTLKAWKAGREGRYTIERTPAHPHKSTPESFTAQTQRLAADSDAFEEQVTRQLESR